MPLHKIMIVTHDPKTGGINVHFRESIESAYDYARQLNKDLSLDVYVGELLVKFYAGREITTKNIFMRHQP